MRGFFATGSVLRILFLIFLSHDTHTYVQCAKVSDLTPRTLTNHSVIPRLPRLHSTKYSLSGLKQSTRHLLERCSEVPIATSLVTSSFLISSTVWLGLLSPEAFTSNGMPRSVGELYLPFTSVLLMPELNGTTIVNLISFYTLLKQAETTSGSSNLLKRVFTNLVAATLVSNACDTPCDFHKFSRAITVTNALENPDQRVNFQGIISMKQWHLPLALLLADYLMTLRTEQAVEGCKATLAGLATYVLCNKL